MRHSILGARFDANDEAAASANRTANVTFVPDPHAAIMLTSTTSLRLDSKPLRSRGRSPSSRVMGRRSARTVVYSRAALAKRIPSANPALHAEIRRFVTERWNFLQPDILDRVMRVLVPSVLAGAPSLKATAELLAMHPRTLNRALQTRGLSFREAVNEARFEMASQLLRDTRLSVGSLPQMLGYSEVSAFTRFFASMAGLSPSKWKQQELARTSS